jgi:hypothetical protein
MLDNDFAAQSMSCCPLWMWKPDMKDIPMEKLEFGYSRLFCRSNFVLAL